MSDDKTATQDVPKQEPTAPEPKTAPAAQPEAADSGLGAVRQQLAESKALSEKLQGRLDAIEHQEAEKSGDLKKVLKLERESRLRLQQEFDGLKAKIVETKIRSAIQEKAKDAHNLDHLLKIGDIKKVTVVQGDVYGADEFVDELRKNSPHLFKIKDVNAGPRVGPDGQHKPKVLSEDYYKEMQKAKTRKELAAVRQKWGVDSGEDKMLINGVVQ